jgi:hypothetical protein
VIVGPVTVFVTATPTHRLPRVQMTRLTQAREWDCEQVVRATSTDDRPREQTRSVGLITRRSHGSRAAPATGRSCSSSTSRWAPALLTELLTNASQGGITIHHQADLTERAGPDLPCQAPPSSCDLNPFRASALCGSNPAPGTLTRDYVVPGMLGLVDLLTALLTVIVHRSPTDSGGRLVLVRRLVREGLLVPTLDSNREDPGMDDRNGTKTVLPAVRRIGRRRP